MHNRGARVSMNKLEAVFEDSDTSIILIYIFLKVDERSCNTKIMKLVTAYQDRGIVHILEAQEMLVLKIVIHFTTIDHELVAGWS